MDASRFDALARSVLTSSRRGTLRFLLGSVLGGLLPLATEPAEAKKGGTGKNRKKRSLGNEACIPTGKPCPSSRPRGRKGRGNGKGKRPKSLSCEQCCQGHVTIGPNGKRVCSCQSAGLPCNGTGECCSGICSGGTCQITADAPAPAPAPPGCTPTTCAAQGKTCGSIPDGCDGTPLTCGTCSNPTPACVSNTCTSCSVSSQCPAGHLCEAGSCQRCDVICTSPDSVACGQLLQAALTAGPTTIRVCPGTYRGRFSISRTVTVIGAGDAAEPGTNTILQGTGSGSVVVIRNIGAVVTLQGVRITGGAAAFGGGIDNVSRTLTLISSTITDNRATSSGGGIQNDFGTLIITDSTITRNTAPQGGGIFNHQGTVTLDQASRVTANTATTVGGGGGIWNDRGTVTLLGPSPSPIVTNNCRENCGGPTFVPNCAPPPQPGFCPLP